MTNFDIAFYLLLMRKRLPVFLAVAMLVGIGGLTLGYVLPSVYRATAKILVESPQIPTDLARSTVPTSAIEQFQIIQVDVLSRQNLLALADRFSIYAGRKGLSQMDMIDDMQARIAFDPVRLDAVGGGAAAMAFDISFDAPDPDLAAKVANELVSMILRKDVELRTGRANGTVQFFGQEVSRLDGLLKDLDSRILQFKNDHIDALPDSLDFRRSQQSAEQQQLLLLTQEEAKLRQRQSDLQTRQPIPGVVASSPESRSLDDLRQALGTQLALFSEDSPTIKALRARIAAVTAQVRIQQTVSQPGTATSLPLTDADFELASIADRMKAIAQERAAIAKKNNQIDASIIATPGNETALNALQRNHQNIQAQYDAAVARLAEASTGQQIELRLKGERLSLIESAIPPLTPVSPKRRLIVGGTLALAFLLGFAAVILPEIFNKRIRRPVELVGKLDIRPMITVPYIVTRGQRSKKRLASMAAVFAVLAAIPLLALALHSYVAPVDLFMNKTLDGLGLSSDHKDG
jgi:succinoglycan biosynthesis transport protein ExoP